MKLKGQTLQLSGGALYNSFYDSNKVPVTSQYKGGAGFIFGIGVTIPIDTIDIDMNFQYMGYQGEILCSNLNKAGGSRTTATIIKKCWVFDLFLFNFNFAEKKFRLSLGFEVNFLNDEKTTGHRDSWLLSQYKTTDFEKGEVKINRSYSFGPVARFSYNFSLGKNWFIVPQFWLYTNFYSEFQNIEAITKSFRQTMQIGLSKKFR